MEKEIKILIDKFWNNQSSVADKRKLRQLLENHEDRWTTLLENEFEKVDHQIDFSTEKSDQILKNLHALISTPESGKKTFQPAYLLKQVYWAAALLLITLSIGIFLNYRNQPEPNFQQPVQLVRQPIKTYHNRSAQAISLDLPDHSVVKLEPNSMISYLGDFGLGHRNIDLVGTANFKVTKNKKLPFTVYANDLSTTALGTQFTVYAGNRHQFRVKLYEGKVVIHAGVKSGIKMKDTYLLPGQELKVNRNNGSSVVNDFKVIDKINKVLINHKPNSVHPQLIFNKEVLPAVFARLSAAYQTKIIYTDVSLEGLSFTGKIEYKDPLPLIISTICALNDLTYSTEDGKITISNKK